MPWVIVLLHRQVRAGRSVVNGKTAASVPTISTSMTRGYVTPCPQHPSGRFPDSLPSMAQRGQAVCRRSYARRIVPKRAPHPRERGSMTYGESDRPEPGGSDARVAAKERAREMRTQHKKQERRRRLILQLGVLGGALAILGVVAVTL